MSTTYTVNPLVVLTIIDQFNRRTKKNREVYGLLVGSNATGLVTAALPLRDRDEVISAMSEESTNKKQYPGQQQLRRVAAVDEDTASVDDGTTSVTSNQERKEQDTWFEYIKKIRDMHCKVYPRDDVLGFYATGSELSDEIAKLSTSTIAQGALLLVDTSLKTPATAGSPRIPMQIFEWTKLEWDLGYEWTALGDVRIGGAAPQSGTNKWTQLSVTAAAASVTANGSDPLLSTDVIREVEQHLQYVVKICDNIIAAGVQDAEINRQLAAAVQQLERSLSIGLGSDKLSSLMDKMLQEIISVMMFTNMAKGQLVVAERLNAAPTQSQQGGS